MTKDVRQAIFRPKARPGESPGSLLLRFSGAIFEQPASALRAYGLSDGEITHLMRKCWRGDTQLLSKIADLSDWKLESFIQEKANSRDHREWMSTRKVSVCPGCADECFLPAIHDLKNVDTCAKHGLTLLTHCPHCSKAISWSRPSLTHCKCLKPLNHRIPASKNSIRLSKKVEELVRDSNSKAIDNLLSFKNVLSYRYQLPSVVAADITLELTDGNMQPLVVAMGRFAQGHKQLNIRAIIAPIRTLLSCFGVSDNEIIARIAQRRSRLKPVELAESFYLNRKELTYALQTTSRSTPDIPGRKFSSGRKSREVISLTSLLDFYGHFSSKITNQGYDNGRTLRELQAATKKPYSDFVSGIVNGTYKPTTAIGESGLPSVIMNYDLSSREGVPTGYLTQRETEAYMELYGVAVTSARQAGLLHAKAQPDRWNRYIYKRGDVDFFMRNYVTCGQLAKRFSTSAKPLKRKLEYLGINPVSGPEIDGTTLYIFAIKDVSHLTKAQLDIAENEYTGVGRKGPEAQRLDEKRWMATKEVISLLQVSSQQLQYLTRVTPLVEGVPETPSPKTTRYFKRDSAKKAKRFIDSLVSIDELARSTNLSRNKLLRRIGQLFKGAVITINKTSFVTPDHAQRFVSHSRDYLCADTAAEFLDCKKSDINNWRRMGLLNAIPPTDENYVGTPHLYLRKDIENIQIPFR